MQIYSEMSALPSIPKGFEAKSRSSKNDSKGRGSLKEKTLDCGQIVWGLAFSPWPSPPSRKLWARHHPQVPDVSCLILATGLNDGQIKIWEVQTGRSFWLVLVQDSVVRPHRCHQPAVGCGLGHTWQVRRHLTLTKGFCPSRAPASESFRPPGCCERSELHTQWQFDFGFCIPG